MARGSASEVVWEREELIGFAPVMVTYNIEGTVTPGAHGSWGEPPDGGDVEIERVYRMDPLTDKEVDVTAAYDFTDKEMGDICEALYSKCTFDDDLDFDDRL